MEKQTEAYIKNLHIYPSNFKYETRILKETKSLVDSGLVDKIFIAAIWATGVKEDEQLDSKREVWRIPLKTKSLPNSSFWKVLKYIEWMLRIFLRFKKEYIKVVHCHSLSSLPIGILFKIFVRSEVIYDAHELETETEGMSGIRKKMFKVIERLLIYYADVIIVVSDSIAGWYKNQYSLEKVHVIKNLPYQQNNNSKHSNVLRKRFNIQDEEVLYIYQGVLGGRRGIEILLNVFSKLDNKKHIVFMGYGVLENIIKEYESSVSNIHFQSAVIPDKVMYYTISADIGIHLIENTCLNHYYCLPNKVFEYILSGLPIIVSDFPEIGKVVYENECGWKVSVDEKTVVDLIKSISKEEIEEKRNNILKCANKFGWHKEEKKLLQVYKEVYRVSGVKV